jgi:hypothetical protein
MKKKGEFFEVVGYEKHENGKIYHRLPDNKKGKDILNVRCDFNMGCEGHHRFYIKHDRKDRYTGLDYPDGGKVFENDKMLLAGYGTYVAEFPFIQLYESYAENDIGHHIGIEGTK